MIVTCHSPHDCHMQNVCACAHLELLGLRMLEGIFGLVQFCLQRRALLLQLVPILLRRGKLLTQLLALGNSRTALLLQCGTFLKQEERQSVSYLNHLPVGSSVSSPTPPLATRAETRTGVGVWVRALLALPHVYTTPDTRAGLGGKIHGGGWRLWPLQLLRLPESCTVHSSVSLHPVYG